MTAAAQRAPRRRPADRRRQLVDAASALFCERGYHNVSVADVATAVEITPAALYRHFRNKQALLVEVINATVDRVAGLVETPDDLAGILEALAVATVQDRSAARLWQQEARHLPQTEREEMRRRVNGIATTVAAAVRAERPELSEADADLLAWSCLAVSGSTSRHRDSLPRRRFEQLLVSLSAAAVRCPLDPAPGGATAERRRTADLPELSLSRRERILDEAIRLFDERGYQSVGTDEVGEAAGTTGPNLYRIFPTKADILAAAMVRGRERRHAAVAQRLAAADTSDAKLRALLRAYIDVATEQSHLIGLLISEGAQLPDRDRRALDLDQRDQMQLWVHLLDQVRPGLDPVAARIRAGAVLGIVHDAVRTSSLARRPDLAERLSAIGEAVLLAPEPTPAT